MFVCTALTKLYYPVIDYLKGMKGSASQETEVTCCLKRLLQKRQQPFASGDMFLFKLFRNKVNHERKRRGPIYYNNKVRDLKDTRIRDWWREVKQLCGNGDSAWKEKRSILRIHTDCTDRDLADKINEAFASVMQEYNPLSDDVIVLCEDDEPIQVTVDLHTSPCCITGLKPLTGLPPMLE